MGRGLFSPMSWRVGVVTTYTNTSEGNYTYGNPSAGAFIGISVVPSANSLSDLGGQSSGYGGGLSIGEGGRFGLNVGVSNISQNPSIESPRSYDLTLSYSGSANIAPVGGSLQQSNSYTDTSELSRSGEEIGHEVKQGYWDWVMMKLNGATQRGPNGGNIHSNYLTGATSSGSSQESNLSIFFNPDSPSFGQSRWDIMGYGNRGDSNALGLSMLTAPTHGSSSSSMWGWFMPKPLD